MTQDRWSPATVKPDWLATYRLQLTPHFPLDSATKILPYLRSLGLSHIYLSPCLTATPGSEHGYDVSDPTTLAEQLGGEEAFTRLATAAQQHGLGLLLDIVPNHMTTHSNPYFEHVLAHGRLSPHASKFDLYDFRKTGEPICIGTLGKPYGDVLKNGELLVVVENGVFRILYYEHSFPTSPACYDRILGENDGSVAELCQRLRQLQQSPLTDAARADYESTCQKLKSILARRIESERPRLEQRLQTLNNDAEGLDQVLRAQHFRLMWWKLEGEFVNYRRFFNIGSLIGVRMEDPEVFNWAHQQIQRLVASGQVQGLRVDHPDGLSDPQAYFDDLRGLMPNGRIYVEKILDDQETLPQEWPVEGTVGYDFLNRVNRLWMDESHAEALTSIYADFTGHPTNYLAVVREQKQFVLEHHFRGDLIRLTALAFVVASQHYETRDISRLELEQAIVLTIVALPVYRTYITDRTSSSEQRKILTDALSLARSFSQPLTDSRALAFDFLERTLVGPLTTTAQKDFLARFQQLAPAVVAKGTEDTTFYRYDRLVSCNEVGAQPASLGISAEHFHEYLSHLHHSWPSNLLTTSTHDTKRSEDVRARISVLSEMPEAWHKQIVDWAQHNESAWKGREPDRHAEYLLYQTLVGAHPLPQERAFDYLRKAVREAKLYTSWHEPNIIYEEKLEEFIASILSNDEFTESLEQFCQPLVYPGRVNSLAQTLIKLTAPGVPDFYQGTELWDLSLVDPDNRRPVDFNVRIELLEQASSLNVTDLAQHWDSGLVKLWMTTRALAVRRVVPNLDSADYRPLIARGEKLRHVIAYARSEHMVVVVPRFLTSIQGDFGDTQLKLPPGTFECAFSRRQFKHTAALGELFERFPVALLVRPDLLPGEL